MNIEKLMDAIHTNKFNNEDIEKYFISNIDTIDIANFKDKIILKKIFNSVDLYINLFEFLHISKRLDVFQNNINFIENLPILLLSYSYFLNNEDIKNTLTKKILLELKNKNELEYKLYPLLVLFCNNEKIDLEYILNNFIFEPNSYSYSSERISFFIDKDKSKKALFNINLNNFNLDNQLIYKNLIYFIYSMYKYSHEVNTIMLINTVASYLNLNNTNLVNIFDKYHINYLYLTKFFIFTENRIRWRYKENTNYNILFSLDLAINNSMKNHEKAKFLDKILSIVSHNNSFDINDFKIDLIYLLKNLEYKKLFSYKNIKNAILKNFILKYNELNSIFYDYGNNFRNNEIDFFSKEDQNLISAEINNYIDTTDDYFRKHLYDYIFNIDNDIELVFSIQFINLFKKKEINKFLNEKINPKTILEFLKFDTFQLERRFNNNLKFNIIKSKNVLKEMFFYFRKNNDLTSIITIFNINHHIFYNNNSLKNYLKENHEVIINNYLNEELILFFFNEFDNLITNEEFDEIIINRVINKEFKLHTLKHLNNNNNIQKIIDNNNIPFYNKWKLLWTFWKKYEDKENIPYLEKNNYIFDFLEDNYLDLLSNKKIISDLIKKPFNRYSEDTKQKEFLESYFSYKKNIELWNILQQLAIEFDIEINPLLKKELYFSTYNNELEDIFEI